MSLSESQTATFDANGRAEAVINGPDNWTSWTLTGTAVSSDSALMPRFRLYRNSESPSAFLGGTFLGSLASSHGSDTFRNGERLVGVWQGGTPGAKAALVVTYEAANQ